MSDLRRYYWDSSVFCSFLNEEENRWKTVEDLLKEGRAGRIDIVTSSFSVVEVLKLKGHKPITEKLEEQITTFFEYPFIKMVDADRNICEHARRYVWRHGLKPKDAVHVATADIASKVAPIHEVFSWDDDFLKLNGKSEIKFPVVRTYLQQQLLNLEDASDSPATSDVPPKSDQGPE